MRTDPRSVSIFNQGETLTYQTSLQQLRSHVDFADATIVTTLPRGSLQITQPRQTHQGRLRSYIRDYYAYDAAAWQSMNRRRPLRQSDMIADPVFTTAAEKFASDLLEPQRLPHYCCVPVRAPVLDGFPGFLQLYRTQKQGDFSDAELQRLVEVVEELDDATHQLRATRTPRTVPRTLRHVLPVQQFAVTKAGGFVFPMDRSALDDVIRDNLLQLAREALSSLDGLSPEDCDKVINGNGGNTDRLLVPDRLGDGWMFRLVVRRCMPGLTGHEEPVALLSLQPEPNAWARNRPSDFAADEEISRLVPALAYMRQNFAGSCSLEEMARTVHLSPFHFHRRFAELLGITPKHYLFDCQIDHAKQLLVEQKTELRDIAEACGFAHQSHFTSRFKQATGLTPTQWRRIALGAMGVNPRVRRDIDEGPLTV